MFSCVPGLLSGHDARKIAGLHGFRSKGPIELVLPVRRSGGNTAGTETEHDSEGHAGSVGRDAALSDRVRNRDAFALGKPGVERVGTRSDRGACPQRTPDWGEPKKDDRLDAQTLARLARIDPQLLSPVKHRSAKAQADLTVIRARAGLVRARTALVNTARGLAKSYGERLRGCNVRNMNPEKAEGLSPELQVALQPLLTALQSLSEQIAQYNERIEKLAQESYPQVALLKQVKGVGTLIALTFLLTLEDPHRFRKSRDVGCYLGLQPGRRNSGQSEPQMHISKEGDPYLRTRLVQGAQHILGPFGVDSDLRGWGLKLAERGGKSGKKRAIIATARKLAVLLHHLWVSGEVYEPLHNSQQSAMALAA
jgi:transposase